MVSGQTPGQAVYETPDDSRKSRTVPWNLLQDGDRQWWEDAAQAGIDVFLAGDSVSAESIREALAAQEPQPAPGLAVGPCPFDGHDGEHLRLNTHGHWLCAVTLTDMLVAADVITDLQPAESRRYREALEQVRAIILEGGNSTEGSRLRRARSVIRAALEGK